MFDFSARTRLGPLLVGAALLRPTAACNIPQGPCVEGFEAGTYEVTLVERYRPGGAYSYDPALVGTAGGSPVDCTMRGELREDTRLVFRTVGERGNTAEACTYQLATFADTRVVGRAESRRGFGTEGWLFMSHDRFRSSSDCVEDLVTSAFLTSGSDPFAEPVPGQRPPVLLGTLQGGVANVCPFCIDFWVVKVTRVGAP